MAIASDYDKWGRSSTANGQINGAAALLHAEKGRVLEGEITAKEHTDEEEHASCARKNTHCQLEARSSGEQVEGKEANTVYVCMQNGMGCDGPTGIALPSNDDSLWTKNFCVLVDHAHRQDRGKQ